MKYFFFCLIFSCFLSSFAFSNPRKIIECSDGGFEEQSLEVYDDGRSYLVKLEVGLGHKHFHLVYQTIRKGFYEFELLKDNCHFVGGVFSCHHFDLVEAPLNITLVEEYGPLGREAYTESVEVHYFTFDLTPVEVTRPSSSDSNVAETRKIRVAGIYGKKSESDEIISAQIDFERKHCTAIMAP